MYHMYFNNKWNTHVLCAWVLSYYMSVGGFCLELTLHYAFISHTHMNTWFPCKLSFSDLFPKVHDVQSLGLLPLAWPSVTYNSNRVKMVNGCAVILDCCAGYLWLILPSSLVITTAYVVQVGILSGLDSPNYGKIEHHILVRRSKSGAYEVWITIYPVIVLIVICWGYWSWIDLDYV